MSRETGDPSQTPSDQVSGDRPSPERTPADDFFLWVHRHLGALWMAAFLVVGFSAGVLTPWDAIVQFADSGDRAAMFVAVGFQTFPLALGAFVITLLVVEGVPRSVTLRMWTVGAVLWVCAVIARSLGLGRVAETDLAPSTITFWLNPFEQMRSAYLSSYGHGLALAGAALGLMLAIHLCARLAASVSVDTDEGNPS